MHPHNPHSQGHLPVSAPPPELQYYERSNYSQPPTVRPKDERHNLNHDYALSTPANRPTMDPTFYEDAFHSQTRPNVRKTTTTSGDVIAYHLYAPKFENHRDSTGHNDTWTPRTKQPLTDTKRGQRVPFPSRCAPKVNQPFQSTASHPMANRHVQQRRHYHNSAEKVEDFNRTVDSIHVSEDFSRPIPTRSLARSEAEQNEITTSSPFQERQFSLDSMSSGKLPLQGGGNFEDMFY